MSHLVEIDPETELEAEPYGYEYGCYMFEEPPVLQTVTPEIQEIIENLEISETKQSSMTESNQTFLIDKIEEVIQQQQKDKFSTILHQLRKRCLVLEKPYFIKERVLCRYVKEGDNLHPSMVIP